VALARSNGLTLELTPNGSTSHNPPFILKSQLYSFFGVEVLNNWCNEHDTLLQINHVLSTIPTGFSSMFHNQSLIFLRCKCVCALSRIGAHVQASSLWKLPTEHGPPLQQRQTQLWLESFGQHSERPDC
jgi:hypothetical protein